MGMAGYLDRCCKGQDDILAKSWKIPTNSDQETDDINEIKSIDKKIGDKKSHYECFTSEELAEINEKININYAKYQKVPLKSSDINLIYKSGVIRSNSSNA